MPRLYREAPLNSIWEGSGNVIALDVLRILAKEPAAVEAFHAEIATVRGADAGSMRRRRSCNASCAIRASANAVGGARRTDGAGAASVAARSLRRSALPTLSAPVASLERAGHCFGTLPPEAGFTAIVRRAAPLR